MRTPFVGKPRALVRTLRVVAVCGFVASSASCFEIQLPSIPDNLPEGAQLADLIVYNARVTTQDPSQPAATAIATKDGRVLATGDDACILARKGPKTQVIDARGRRLIPGLNDNHLHAIISSLKYNLNIRWDGVPTLELAMDMLKEQAERTPDGQWVKAVGGWSPKQFIEQRLPTPRELDLAVPNRPAMVQFAYNTAVFNSKAMEALGVGGPAFPVFPETEWERDENGQLTGVLQGKPSSWSFWIIEFMVPQPTEEWQESSLRYAFREFNRVGLTSISDAGTGSPYPPPAPVMNLMKTNELPLRISLMESPTQGIDALIENITKTNPIKPGENIHPHMDFGFTLEGMGEVILVLPEKMDAVSDWENFTFPMVHPPADRTRRVTEETVTKLLEHRIPFRIHATYDETISPMLDGLEAVNRKTPLDGLRWSIEHAETISDQNIRRIHALGGGIGAQGRMAMHGDSFAETNGLERAKISPPLRKILDSGVPLSLGTDGMRAATYNPWVTLAWAVSGRSVSGQEVLGASQRLTRAEALSAYTLGSAWQQGQEKHKGRLAPGFLADFALLSADYMTIPAEDIDSIHSVMTVLDGRVVYGEGEYEELAPVLPPISPAWAPVRYWPGFHPGDK